VVGAAGAKGLMAQVPHSTQVKNIHIHINIYILACIFYSCPQRQNKREREREQGSVPWTSTRVQRFLQAFQDKGDRREGILSCLQKLGNVLNKHQAQLD
jgi:hypothetical protein